jgi:hypothetical protein
MTEAVDYSNLILGNTALARLTEYRVPFALPEAQRNEHTVIIAGSGRGKTQTLASFIWNDLQQDRPPGMVVIDSKRDFVERLSKLGVFNPDNGRLRDKIIYIDPRDGPALNPLDIGFDDIEAASLEDLDEVVNGIISEMSYFFRSLLGGEISSTMSGVFNPLVQLLIRYPGATLQTFADAIENPAPFANEVDGLTPTLRKFLTVDYQNIMGRETKNAVKRRIYNVLLDSPTFGVMFGANKNKLKLTEALQQGKLVLVSTRLDDFSSLFGRYIISQTMIAARRIPERQRKLSYLIVDEAGDYFDQRTESLLRTMRSYKLGAVLAFQDWAMAPATLRSAITANTAIKLMGSESVSDAHELAPDMRTTPEFILSLGKEDDKYSDFACYVRGMPKAVALRVPLDIIDSDKVPYMTEEQRRRYRAANKAALTDELTPTEPRRDTNITDSTDTAAKYEPTPKRPRPSPSPNENSDAQFWDGNQ